jgi:hypothetical protein
VNVCPWCSGALDVRFMRPGIEKSWRYGRLVSLPADNVEIDVLDHGGRYVIAREYVQVKKMGPRGGTKWESL